MPQLIIRRGYSPFSNAVTERKPQLVFIPHLLSDQNYNAFALLVGLPPMVGSGVKWFSHRLEFIAAFFIPIVENAFTAKNFLTFLIEQRVQLEVDLVFLQGAILR